MVQSAHCLSVSARQVGVRAQGDADAGVDIFWYNKNKDAKFTL